MLGTTLGTTARHPHDGIRPSRHRHLARLSVRYTASVDSGPFLDQDVRITTGFIDHFFAVTHPPPTTPYSNKPPTSQHPPGTRPCPLRPPPTLSPLPPPGYLHRVAHTKLLSSMDPGRLGAAHRDVAVTLPVLAPASSSTLLLPPRCASPGDNPVPTRGTRDPPPAVLIFQPHLTLNREHAITQVFAGDCSQATLWLRVRPRVTACAVPAAYEDCLDH